MNFDIVLPELSPSTPVQLTHSRYMLPARSPAMAKNEADISCLAQPITRFLRGVCLPRVPPVVHEAQPAYSTLVAIIAD